MYDCMPRYINSVYMCLNFRFLRNEMNWERKVSVFRIFVIVYAFAVIVSISEGLDLLICSCEHRKCLLSAENLCFLYFSFSMKRNSKRLCTGSD